MCSRCESFLYCAAEAPALEEDFLEEEDIVVGFGKEKKEGPANASQGPTLSQFFGRLIHKFLGKTIV